MEKNTHRLSLVLIAYSITLFVFSTIILCSSNVCSGMKMIVYSSIYFISVLSVVCAMFIYKKEIKLENEEDIKGKIVELKKNIEELKEHTTTDNTQENEKLKMLREHELRLAIIKAMGKDATKEKVKEYRQILDEMTENK